jgi:hypothetical protein
MTLLEKYIAKVGEMRKTPLNEERESVAEIHNAALDEVQSLLPELIKEVVEETRKELLDQIGALGRDIEDENDLKYCVNATFASLKEPNK